MKQLSKRQYRLLERACDYDSDDVFISLAESVDAGEGMRLHLLSNMTRGIMQDIYYVPHNRSYVFYMKITRDRGGQFTEPYRKYFEIPKTVCGETPLLMMEINKI